MGIYLHDKIPGSFIHFVDFSRRLRTPRTSIIDHSIGFRQFSLKEPRARYKEQERAEPLHVQSPSRLDCFLNQHLHIPRYSDIGLDVYCFSFSITLANQVMGGGSGFGDAPTTARGGANVGADYGRGAVGGECEGDGPAEARRGARYDGYAGVKASRE